MTCETCGRRELEERDVQTMHLTDTDGAEESYVRCHRCALRAEAERKLLAIAVADELERRARNAAAVFQIRRSGGLN